MQALHLNQMAADHRISRSLKRTACQHIEHGVLLVFFCRLFRRRKHVFLCFCDNFVDLVKALHGFFVVRIAFQLMQQLKRNSKCLRLISLRINLMVAVGIGDNVLSNLRHARFHRARHRNRHRAGVVCRLDRLNRFGGRLQRAADDQTLSIQLDRRAMHELVAVVNLDGKRFALTVKQVFTRENSSLRTAAAYEIDRLQSACLMGAFQYRRNDFLNLHNSSPF